MLRRIKKIARRLLRRQTRNNIDAKHAQLTATQQLFVEWNAERLNISREDSLQRYIKSWLSVKNGHGGDEFRDFDLMTHNVFEVIVSDQPGEVFEAYKFHAHLHFLRYLSYPEPTWKPDDPVIRELGALKAVSILDFGCGLAQHSRSLARALIDAGAIVSLHLADIPTIRKDFLLWAAKKDGIEAHFLDCTATTPLPELGSYHACFAQEFFEHVYDPLKYAKSFAAALVPGGFLITNVRNHEAEFFHVHPELENVRRYLLELGCHPIEKYSLFQKRGAALDPGA